MDQQADARLISCLLCASNNLQVLTKVSHYVNHLKLFHAHQSNFKVTCGIDGCVRTFTNIGTFKNHVSLLHYGSLPTLSDASGSIDQSHFEADSVVAESDQTVAVASTSSCSTSSVESVPLVIPNQEALKKSSALFLLGLKEKHKLTQVAIQDIVDNVTNLTQQRLSAVKLQVISCRYVYLEKEMCVVAITFKSLAGLL